MRTAPEPAEHHLAREMRLVDSAIALVASGRAPRVQLGALAYGDALLEYARREAPGRQVRVVPRWRTDEAGLDLVFEPAGPGGGDAAGGEDDAPAGSDG